MDLNQFSVAFNKCLNVCFEFSENLPCIDTALDFASKFIVSLSEGLEEDETCPFLSNVFHFMLEVIIYIVCVVKLCRSLTYSSKSDAS